MEEICLCASELSNGQRPGVDGIPNEFYKVTPGFIYAWVSDFISCAFSHFCLPSSLTDVVVVLILKPILKDLVDANNCTPMAIASGDSKLIEKSLLVRLKTFISTSCNQFGIKENHSAGLCVFETIDYYRKLETPIFACFIDIRGVFDRICHSRLFEKLSRRGTPAYILHLLKTWYSHQRLFAKWPKWGNAVSDVFFMNNGIRQGSILSPHLFNLLLSNS